MVLQFPAQIDVYFIGVQLVWTGQFWSTRGLALRVRISSLSVALVQQSTAAKVKGGLCV